MEGNAEGTVARPGWDVARECLSTGRVAEAVAEILSIVSEKPTAANYWRAERELRTVDLRALAPSPGAIARIAILGTSTLDALRGRVFIDCLRAGLVPELYQGEYGQCVQAILDDAGPLYAFKPDLAFVSLRLEDLLPELRDADAILPGDLVGRVVGGVTRLAERFTARSKALLVIHNFLVPAHSPYGVLENKGERGRRRVIAELNLKLEDAFRDNRQVFVLDYEHLAGVFGKDGMCDPRRLYLADMEWTDEFVAALSGAYLGYVKPAKGILRKCIVLDLDGTLWGGVLGESGFDGIQLDVQPPGNQFRDFQRALLELHQRGLILAINSKNNFDEAVAVIREHPYMALREKHFAAMKINWADKVTNLREIAEELNIGLDSMVFIDDSPAERLYVRQALPEVLTVELPADPALYRKTLERLNDFSALSLTEEDRRRGGLYAAEFARARLRSVSGSMEEFLASLRMTLIVRLADSFSIARVAQLTQRTNQFNLTTRRYSEGEIAAMLGSPGCAVYTLKVTDIFGDNGLVGVAILRERDNEVWRIDSFLLSCRVLGRRVETYFLHALVRDLQKRGVRAITGEFFRTKKNEVAKDFYQRHGFRLLEEGEEGSRWEFALDRPLGVVPEWVRIDAGTAQGGS